MKPKAAIIWRKTVYDTGLCPVCGAELADKETMNPNEDNTVVGLDLDGHPAMIFCGGCGLYVGRLSEYYGDKELGTKAGEWPGDE